MIKRLDGRAAALLTLSILFLGCREPDPVPPPLRPVRVQRIETSDTIRTRTFTGTARAGMESKMSFRVAGSIMELPVSIGDFVESGALLARLDPTDYRRATQDAAANLASAKAKARNAEADYVRVSGLYESRNASKADLDAARAARESAQANVTSAEKRLEQAQAELGYTRLTAPARGAVLEVLREANENVRPGDTVLLLASASRPEVELAIPEVLITQVRPGQSARIRFAAVPGTTLNGRVSEVGLAPTGLATTFPVTVEILGEWSDVRAGMAAEVALEFPSGRTAGKILVPAFAVGEDRDGRFAFVAEPAGDGTAMVRRRSVLVGELLPEGLEIRDGLTEGELLVTAGISRVHDGQRVKLPADQS